MSDSSKETPLPTVGLKPTGQTTTAQLAGQPTQPEKPVELAKVVTESKPTPAPTVGKMPLCNCWVKINKNDSVFRKEVTPMEMLFLVAEHHKHAGGNPIEQIEVLTKVANRTPSDELQRLYRQYNATKLAKLFPGALPQDAGTFDAAQQLGVRMTLGKQNLIDHQIS